MVRAIICSTHCLQVYTIREIRDRDENSRSHPPAILAAQDQLLALNEKLEHIRSPHVCRYRTFEIKSSLAYMLRPYLYSTLHDRVLVCYFEMGLICVL